MWVSSQTTGHRVGFTDREGHAGAVNSHPSVLFRLALARRQIGRSRDAQDAFQQFRAAGHCSIICPVSTVDRIVFVAMLGISRGDQQCLYDHDRTSRQESAESKYRASYLLLSKLSQRR